MIYFIVTTSIYNDCENRKQKYLNGINTLINLEMSFDYKIIIIENNGYRKTFLDDFKSEKCKVIYTNNNYMDTPNKGTKELMDILDCITLENLHDEDFIVKMTGRYILEKTSPFLVTLHKIDNIDCIIRFGSFNETSKPQCHDCITGLIGMRCKYIKLIRKPNLSPVEWNWARTTYLIQPERIYSLDTLGISICPGISDYKTV